MNHATMLRATRSPRRTRRNGHDLFGAERRAITLMAFLVTVVIAGPVSGQPNLVNNGGFELPHIALSYTPIPSGSSSLTGWTVSGTSGIDLVGALWQPAEGAQSISLNWTSPCAVSQVIATEPGRSYRLSFKMAAESPQAVSNIRSMVVLWGGTTIADLQFDPAGHTNANMGWAYHEYIVTGDGSDELRFQSTTTISDDYGPTLDAVSLEPLTAGDLNGDLAVNAADLALLLGAWGGPAGDLNGDGTTDGADLAVLLGAWTG